ncbi:uncharacterized protein [Penaeus vannamei]|uniref:uncharacterized protein n=1 Tax=Penaeus vannamei TaxID=6689 RepID=UPI00387F5D34
MRCSTLHGMAFIYKDGTCDIYGPSQVDFSGQERLFRRLISPPPGPLEEVSRGKPSEATANYPSFYPHNAVDDSDSTMYHSANGIARAWWMIDLLQHRLVRAVEVLPRYDFAPAVGRFHDVEKLIEPQIRVSSTPRNGEDFSSWNLIGQYAGPYTAAEWRLNFTHDIGICGRYVVVQKVSSDTDHLQIVDVRVYVAPMMPIS